MLTLDAEDIVKAVFILIEKNKDLFSERAGISQLFMVGRIQSLFCGSSHQSV